MEAKWYSIGAQAINPMSSFHRLCRAEIERWNGECHEAEHGSGAAVPLPPAGSVGGDGFLTPPRFFTELFKDYFAHHGHRDERTNHEKDVAFLVKIIGGDKPVQEIVKADCIRFRDTFSRFPRRIPDRLHEKPIADMLRSLEGQQGVARVTKRTVTLALKDLKHFFSWSIRHDHFSAKNLLTASTTKG